jgi:2-keto-3-deoxy-L-rhamnonate aldolase RhmA
VRPRTLRTNTAKRELAAGHPVSVVTPTYTSAGLVELLGRSGFDVIFLDTEHGSAGWDAVEDMVRVAELCDVTPIVRVQSHDVSTITRALDRGAGGVQIPHVNTRAEAQAVAATRSSHPSATGVRRRTGRVRREDG